MSPAEPSLRQLHSLPMYQSTSPSRLKFLYSDFTRHKQSNPSSYMSNIEWWRRTLEAVVLKGWQSHSATETGSVDKLILHANGPALAEVFRLEGVGKPIGLPGVIAELSNSKAYYPLGQFLASAQSIYDPGWLPYRIASFVVGKPLWWALQQLSIVGDDTGHTSGGEQWSSVKGDYVVTSLLEKAADAILKSQQPKARLSLADNLFNFESFSREFAGKAFDEILLSREDMKVVLKYLERDKKVVVVQEDVIKFIHSGDVPDINAVDIGVLELKQATANLETSIDRIQREIDDRSSKIATALKQKRNEMAMSHLRARKQLEDLLRKRLGSLDILHSTLLRVEASAGDVQIMRTYESSTATLRAVLAHPLLQREKVDETMDAMASANAEARDIDDAIKIGMDVAQTEAGVDDAELEDELNKLIAEEVEVAQRESVQEKHTKLSAEELAVPSHTPSSPGHTAENVSDRIRERA